MSFKWWLGVQPNRRFIFQASLIATGVSILLTLLRGTELWNTSDGIYLLSGMELAKGRSLYSDIAASQPPNMYLLVAAATSIYDSWVSSRIIFNGLQVVTAVLVAVTALRLGANRQVALVGSVWALLTPWALRHHGEILPEVLATPLLLTAILLACNGQKSKPFLAGLVASLIVGVKLPMILPVAGLLLFADKKVRSGQGFFVGMAAQISIWSLWFGPVDVWRGTVVAQTQIGAKALSEAAPYYLQAVWSLLPLVVCALVALVLLPSSYREQGSTMRVLLAVSLGGALSLLSLIKRGTIPLIEIPVEALLLPISLVGISEFLRRMDFKKKQFRLMRIYLSCAVGLALLAPLALLLSPDAPRGFTWPAGGSNWGRIASETQVDLQRSETLKCPQGTAWGGDAWVAVLEGRRVRGDQPDQFILLAPTYEDKARVAGSAAYCPYIKKYL